MSVYTELDRTPGHEGRELRFSEETRMPRSLGVQLDTIDRAAESATASFDLDQLPHAADVIAAINQRDNGMHRQGEQ